MAARVGCFPSLLANERLLLSAVLKGIFQFLQCKQTWGSTSEKKCWWIKGFFSWQILKLRLLKTTFPIPPCRSASRNLFSCGIYHLLLKSVNLALCHEFNILLFFSIKYSISVQFLQLIWQGTIQRSFLRERITSLCRVLKWGNFLFGARSEYQLNRGCSCLDRGCASEFGVRDMISHGSVQERNAWWAIYIFLLFLFAWLGG